MADLRPVDFTWTTRRSVDEVGRWVSGSLVPVVRKAGYRLERSTPTDVVLLRPNRTGWPLLAISWLAFLASDQRARRTVVRIVATAEGRTSMFVIGDLPGRIAAILEQLRDD